MSQNQLITAYAAAKIVNAALVNAGIDKKIPPQMMYTYVKKGYVPSKDGLVVVEGFMAWLSTYIGKQQPNVSDPEQAEFDLAEAN